MDANKNMLNFLEKISSKGETGILFNEIKEQSQTAMSIWSKSGGIVLKSVFSKLTTFGLFLIS